MNKKLNFFTICSFLTTLILLFVTSSTDLILKPEVDRIYKATLLISDVDSGLWQNYKLGVKYASEKYNVDMAIKTLFSFHEDTQQQLEQIMTEIEFGAEGLILSTSHFSKTSKLVEEENFKNAVIFTKVDSSFCSDTYGDYSYVYYDYYGAGKMLGEILQKEHENRKDIFILTERELSENHTFFIQALKETHHVSILQNATLETEGLQQIKTAFGDNDIIIGLDENSTLHFTEVKDMPIYSLGHTNTLIDCVLQGEVEGLICFDEYKAGFLSVRNLVTVLEGGTIPTCEKIPYKLITKETIFENEAFLFPIQ
ncbi:MAG: substrate-binding domain-containing protein [Bacillota bacterium]